MDKNNNTITYADEGLLGDSSGWSFGDWMIAFLLAGLLLLMMFHTWAWVFVMIPVVAVMALIKYPFQTMVILLLCVIIGLLLANLT